MTNLKCRDNAADKVVAGNVIHLLEDPRLAIRELERVCKPGGKVIIPTYINIERKGRVNLFVKAFQWLGAEFRRQFDYESYQAFFAELGYEDVEYRLTEGRMPCAIAVFTPK